MIRSKLRPNIYEPFVRAGRFELDRLLFRRPSSPTLLVTSANQQQHFNLSQNRPAGVLTTLPAPRQDQPYDPPFIFKGLNDDTVLVAVG